MTLILNLSRNSALRSNLDYHLIRAAMIFTFYIFSYQKWFSFEAQQITPFIAHSPLVFWLIPAFGVRGASFFLGTTELFFGTLIFLGYWNAKLGTLGALGSIFTFFGTVSIIPFLPNAWAVEAGGFPAMYLPVAFLVKDFLFLAARSICSSRISLAWRWRCTDWGRHPSLVRITEKLRRYVLTTEE